MNTRIRTSLVGLALAAIVATSGCTLVPTADPSEPLPQNPTESTAPLEPSEDPTMPEPSSTPEDLTLRFGETVTYEDGFAITVSKPKSFKPSEYAAYPEDADRYVKFTVTVKNGTNQRIDPSGISTTASSGDEEMEEVFDTENNLDGSPQTKLLKGKTVRYQIGYGSLKGKDFVLEVSPTCLDPDCELNYESALFVS
jgi:hypothetical protein